MSPCIFLLYVKNLRLKISPDFDSSRRSISMNHWNWKIHITRGSESSYFFFFYVQFSARHVFAGEYDLSTEVENSNSMHVHWLTTDLQLLSTNLRRQLILESEQFNIIFFYALKLPLCLFLSSMCAHEEVATRKISPSRICRLVYMNFYFRVTSRLVYLGRKKNLPLGKCCLRLTSHPDACCSLRWSSQAGSTGLMLSSHSRWSRYHRN